MTALRAGDLMRICSRTRGLSRWPKAPRRACAQEGEEVAHVSGKDSEIAELNAQRFGQVLKRALRRSKQSKGK
jgi:hypothetical protein